jgi:hypothetical protein
MVTHQIDAVSLLDPHGKARTTTKNQGPEFDAVNDQDIAERVTKYIPRGQDFLPKLLLGAGGKPCWKGFI